MMKDTKIATAAQQRSAWLRILTKWHWISSALSLVGMLFFATTGITLNNAEFFENPTPVTIQRSATLPREIFLQVEQKGVGQNLAMPDSLRAWVRDFWGISIYPKSSDWRSDEVFIDLKRPGVDAWLSIDRKTGVMQYQADDRGWIAFFNDLHKGKSAGSVWHWLITLFGVCCVIFSLTGLFILQIHAKSRWSIWPITGLGLVIPLLAILIFVH